MSQTAIPATNWDATQIGPCNWCGDTGVAQIELEKARWGNDRGVKICTRAPIMANVCAKHKNILNLQPKDA